MKDVNSVLEPKLPASLMKNKKDRRESVEVQEKKEVQQVDIFGNRIDDVDAWLREQDKKPLAHRRPRSDLNNRSERTQVDEGGPKTKSGAKVVPKLFNQNNLQRRPKNPVAH